jgi:hypothetical protein
VALHLLSSSVPHVRHVPLPAAGEPSMPLLHAAPWSRLLTPVGSGAARIGAAIETIRPAHVDGVASAVPPRSCGPGGRRCGLGAALRATLEAVGGGGGGFGSARLLLLLGGPPNYGDGKLASGRAPSEVLAEAAAAARRPAAGLLDVDVEEGGAPGGAAGGAAGGGGGGGDEGAEDADRALLRPPRGARPLRGAHHSPLMAHRSLLTTHRSLLPAHRSLRTMMAGARLYEELTDEAAAAGLAISLFAVAPAGGACAELAALRPLPLRSGGVLNFYPSAAEAPAPSP